MIVPFPGEFVQNYGEHGRELITVEVALRLLQVLADPSAELERADMPGGPGKARLKALLHNSIFKVGVPCHSCSTSTIQMLCVGLIHDSL